MPQKEDSKKVEANIIINWLGGMETGLGECWRAMMAIKRD